MASTGGDAVVIIKPKNMEQKSDITRTEIKTTMDSTNMDVAGLRNVTKEGVFIHCKNKEASAKVQQKVKQKLGASYEVIIPDQRRPRIKIVGMTEKLTDEQLTDKIRAQNDTVQEGSNLKVIFTGNMVGKKDGYFSVLEIDEPAFIKFMANGKINIGWDRCKVFEAFRFLIWFECHGCNHVTNDCKIDQKC